MSRCYALAVLAVMMLAAGARPALAQSSRAKNAEFEAAVVYNFARFATWPPARFADASAAVVLCVDPAEPLTPALVRLDGRPVGTRRLRVRAVQSFEAGCHMAFVPSAQATPAHLASLNRQGLLTVGDAPGFSKSGAIGLVAIGRQVRFEVNARAARQANVGLSAQLLRLSTVVRQ